MFELQRLVSKDVGRAKAATVASTMRCELQEFVIFAPIVDVLPVSLSDV